MDRALWTFTRIVENEQDEAVERLPASAKPKTHARTKQRILEKYLGVESTTTQRQFKDPGQ